MKLFVCLISFIFIATNFYLSELDSLLVLKCTSKWIVHRRKFNFLLKYGPYTKVLSMHKCVENAKRKDILKKSLLNVKIYLILRISYATKS